MEMVSLMFYWGGNIVSDPEEGASYDIDPSYMCNVRPPITLNNLEQMLLPRLASPEDNVRLKFKCRFPQRQWANFVKYKVVPINDDDTLNSILSVAMKLQSQNSLELYVDKVPFHDAPQMMTFESRPFTRLLSQGIGCTGIGSPNLSDHFTLCHHNRMGIFSLDQFHSQHVGSTSGMVNDVEVRGRVPGSNDNIPFVEQFTDIDSMGIDEFEDEDFHDMVTEEEDNEDEGSGDDNDGGDHIPTESGGGNMRESQPPPFYENIHMGSDDFFMTSRDVIPRSRMWNAEKAELAKGMTFNDKKQLQYAVKLYHLKNNREYEVVKSVDNLWVCRCKHGCSWKLRASKNTSKHNFFEIKQYDGSHHCLYARTNRDNSNLDSNFIAWCIMGQVAICCIFR